MKALQILLPKIKTRELLFPKRCLYCDEILPLGADYICSQCRPQMKYVTEPKCLKCGKELQVSGGKISDRKAEEIFCRDCKEHSHLYEKGLVLYDYRQAAPSIYRFKYQGRQEYAYGFGKEFHTHLGTEIMNWKPQGLVPVPIHPARKRMRGYNQAQRLAEAMGKEMKIPVYTNLVKRVQNTIPQKNLGYLERQNNLKKAFNIGQNDVKLDTIIIIDDIYTTGSTIDAVAAVLQQAGISRIYYAALTAGAFI